MTRKNHPAYLLSGLLLLLFVTACANKPATEAFKPAANPEVAPVDLTFAAFDANKSGKIEYKEYLDRMAMLFGYLDANWSQHVEPHEIHQHPAWMKMSDASKDGKLTIIEFLNAADEEFYKNSTGSEKVSKRTMSAKGFAKVQLQ